MKATKTELIRLARLAQKDIASGRVSKNAQQAVEALSDYQNSAIELLDLTLEEATQEQSNKSLVDSFGFLFGQSLEALRFDIESGYRIASELAESVRKRLVTVSKAKACDPFTLLFLVQCFGAAKLDLGRSFQIKKDVARITCAAKSATAQAMLRSLATPKTTPFFPLRRPSIGRERLPKRCSRR
jgi:hypothetical protein